MAAAKNWEIHGNTSFSDTCMIFSSNRWEYVQTRHTKPPLAERLLSLTGWTPISFVLPRVVASHFHNMPQPSQWKPS